MTNDEFLESEAKILARIPQEFRATLSVMAYSRSHAYGYNEVIGTLTEMVYDLLPAIEAFETRIRNEKQ